MPLKRVLTHGACLKLPRHAVEESYRSGWYVTTGDLEGDRERVALLRIEIELPVGKPFTKIGEISPKEFAISI